MALIIKQYNTSVYKCSAQQSVTVPRIFSGTGTGTFFRDQIFPVPGPVLFSGTKFFRYLDRYFFPGPNFSGTGTGTFFRDQFFPIPVPVLFSGTIFFRNRYRYHPKKGRIPGTGTKPVPYGTFLSALDINTIFATFNIAKKSQTSSFTLLAELSSCCHHSSDTAKDKNNCQGMQVLLRFLDVYIIDPCKAFLSSKNVFSHPPYLF